MTHEEKLAELGAASADLAREREVVDRAINLRVAIKLAEHVRAVGKLPGNAPQCLGALVALLEEIERNEAAFPFYAVCDPQGCVNHTTLSTREDESIAVWMKQEQTLVPVLRGKPAQSWEVFEAEGYAVVRCAIISRRLPCRPPGPDA